MKQVIYFAHSMKSYGSKDENKCLKAIKKWEPDMTILNPNNSRDFNSDMSHFLKLVRNSDIIVCREYKKYVGRGVYEEVQKALHLQKPVFVLRYWAKNPKFIPVKNVYIVNSNDWTIMYGKVVI